MPSEASSSKGEAGVGEVSYARARILDFKTEGEPRIGWGVRGLCNHGKLAEGTRLLGQRQRTSWRHSKQHVLRVQVASCSGWFLSPFAVVTKDHSLSDLKQPTSVLLQFSSAEVRDQ